MGGELDTQDACIYSHFLPCTDGLHVETGGIIDPERGAVVFRKTTEVETIEPGPGSDFSRKKVKKVTDELTWIDEPKKPLIPYEGEDDIEMEPWHDEQVEQNPLYSEEDYQSDFQNPLYTRRMSAAEGAVIVATGALDDDDETALLAPRDGGRAARGKPGAGDHGQGYLDYLSAQPGLDTVDTVDTLF